MNRINMKCHFENCKKSVVIIGDCKYCNKKYCMTHRLVEEHLCPNIIDCRNQAHKKFAEQLVANKCVAVKVDKI